MKPSEIEFCKLVSDYLNVYLPELRGLSENTIRSYRTTLGQLVDHMAVVNPRKPICMERATRECVTQFLDECTARGCADTTRNQKLAAIGSFTKYCSIKNVSHSRAVAEVAQVPRKKTASKPVGFLDEDCLTALLRQPDPQTKKRAA